MSLVGRALGGVLGPEGEEGKAEDEVQKPRPARSGKRKPGEGLEKQSRRPYGNGRDVDLEDGQGHGVHESAKVPDDEDVEGDGEGKEAGEGVAPVESHSRCEGHDHQAGGAENGGKEACRCGTFPVKGAIKQRHHDDVGPGDEGLATRCGEEQAENLEEELGGDHDSRSGGRQQETAFDPGNPFPEEGRHDKGGDSQADCRKPQGAHLLEKKIAYRVAGSPEDGNEKDCTIG